MSVDLYLKKTKSKLEDWKSKTDYSAKGCGYNWDYPEEDIKDPTVFWWNGNHNLNISEFFSKLPGVNESYPELIFLTEDDLEAFEFYVEELQEHAKNCKGVIEAIKKAKKEGYNIFYKRV